MNIYLKGSCCHCWFVEILLRSPLADSLVMQHLYLGSTIVKSVLPGLRSPRLANDATAALVALHSVLSL
jgi:hypothetical protein